MPNQSINKAKNPFKNAKPYLEGKINDTTNDTTAILHQGK